MGQNRVGTSGLVEEVAVEQGANSLLSSKLGYSIFRGHLSLCKFRMLLFLVFACVVEDLSVWGLCPSQPEVFVHHLLLQLPMQLQKDSQS